ncbi:MAG TPA: penicillin-binding transpeptidase domain-containing protein [Anaerolineales bacterium]|nr:penicillin-binding transpeptidase domain-containing protein [Anaerolineales bacterium]
MKRWFLFFMVLLLAACSPGQAATSTPAATATRSLGDPGVRTTSVPDASMVARAYLDAWKAEDYATMYSLLTSVSQAAISEEDFSNQYRSVAAEAALSTIDYQIHQALINPDQAQISYEVTLNSSLVGEMNRNTQVNLSLEQGEWRVQWDDALILPELVGGNYLGMDVRVPARANIYDRDGRALVAEAADAVAIGLYPDQIFPDQVDLIVSELARVLDVPNEQIRGRLNDFPYGSGWYLPLGEVSADRIDDRYTVLSGLSGLVLRSYKSRYYFEGGVAPHVVGYVSQIQADEADEYKRKGYRPDERIGRIGLERWGEPYLAGKRGGELFVFNAQGQPVTSLAQVGSEPSKAIYTTLERDFQLGVQDAIAGFNAAVVVLERDTGRVLAMASSPGFDPNAFEPTNINFETMLAELFSDPNTPTFNRAAQGQYPLGSVFKIITMAAALESGVYTPESVYQCGWTFDELSGVTLYDWTYEKDYSPSGLLTLPQGLIRSCNPWFYHIGLDLYNQGQTTAISEMARSFGLGAPVGIEGIEEASGQVPDPESPLDATNGAIGQGALLVTPLQVANFAAALGNGGTLYRPQLIERVTSPDGEPLMEFAPEEMGELPISPATLQIIRDAMVGVVRSTDPVGTAWHRFTGLDINVAGKTGTAQSGSGEPHSWFAGYTFEERPNRPDIAVAVVVENIGEGSDYAAPIFRRIIELYFYGQPAKYYWWESSIGVTRTPTPNVTETPTPQGFEPTRTPQPTVQRRNND